MTKSNALKRKARETIKYLQDEHLITREHSLTIQLIYDLCDEWDVAGSSTQKMGISKEIRLALELLPKPETKISDEAEEFLSSLQEDD